MQIVEPANFPSSKCVSRKEVKIVVTSPLGNYCNGIRNTKNATHNVLLYMLRLILKHIVCYFTYAYGKTSHELQMGSAVDSKIH